MQKKYQHNNNNKKKTHNFQPKFLIKHLKKYITKIKLFNKKKCIQKMYSKNKYKQNSKCFKNKII